jgi:hypothetical protein
VPKIMHEELTDLLTGSDADGAPWQALAASVPGRKHIRSGIPCQDASVAGFEPYPFVVVADGRGSSANSHLGAQASCAAVSELIRSSTCMLREILDGHDDGVADSQWGHLATMLFEATRTRQRAIAGERQLSQAELEHTLLLSLWGKRRIACLHVGDGAIVLEHNGVDLSVSSAPERGEYANQTCFVGARTRAEQVRRCLILATDVTGLAAMTDGTAERMLHSQTQKPAPGFSELFKKVRQGTFRERDLLRFLTETFWEPQVQDDRSLAVLVMQNETLPEIDRSKLLLPDRVGTEGGGGAQAVAEMSSPPSPRAEAPILDPVCGTSPCTGRRRRAQMCILLAVATGLAFATGCWVGRRPQWQKWAPNDSATKQLSGRPEIGVRATRRAPVSALSLVHVEPGTEQNGVSVRAKAVAPEDTTTVARRTLTDEPRDSQLATRRTEQSAEIDAPRENKRDTGTARIGAQPPSRQTDTRQ